jgi:hypothetical protein
MSEPLTTFAWQSIDTAPKDGTVFRGRMIEVINMMTQCGPRGRLGQKRHLVRKTWWGKTSHVPLYGWCHGRVENVDLWRPTHWKPLQAPEGSGPHD